MAHLDQWIARSYILSTETLCLEPAEPNPSVKRLVPGRGRGRRRHPETQIRGMMVIFKQQNMECPCSDVPSHLCTNCTSCCSFSPAFVHVSHLYIAVQAGGQHQVNFSHTIARTEVQASDDIEHVIILNK